MFRPRLTSEGDGEYIHFSIEEKDDFSSKLEQFLDPSLRAQTEKDLGSGTPVVWVLALHTEFVGDRQTWISSVLPKLAEIPLEGLSIRGAHYSKENCEVLEHIFPNLVYFESWGGNFCDRELFSRLVFSCSPKLRVLSLTSSPNSISVTAWYLLLYVRKIHIRYGYDAALYELESEGAKLTVWKAILPNLPTTSSFETMSSFIGTHLEGPRKEGGFPTTYVYPAGACLKYVPA